jgi:hypothetical protein
VPTEVVKITGNMSSKNHPVLFQSTNEWYQVSGFRCQRSTLPLGDKGLITIKTLDY